MVNEDIADMATLEEQIFSDAWSECALADSFRQEHSLIYVVEVKGHIEGYCILYYVLEEAEIVRIAVSEDMRRQGVGDSLLSTMWEWCHQQGITRITLEVRENNHTAIRLYQKHEFASCAIRKAYYTCPVEDGIIMAKVLL